MPAIAPPESPDLSLLEPVVLKSAVVVGLALVVEVTKIS